jgi:predicted flavoprotein YhiN
MIEFFEDEVGIPLVLETDTAKLFPRSNRARDVRDGLVSLALRCGTHLRFNTRLDQLTSIDGGWELSTSAGPIRASRVILATGGLSVPLTGSDGLGLRLAGTLGHKIHDTYPALTPLLCEPALSTAHSALSTPHPALSTPHPALSTPHPAPHSAPSPRSAAPHSAPRSLHPAPLAGLSLPVRLRARSDEGTVETRGGFLFTHKGYSGPAVLDLSHVCVRSERGSRAELRVAWAATSAREWEARLTGPDRHVLSIAAADIPERLALTLMSLADVPRDRRTSALTRGERARLIARLTACELPWTGHEGYKKAEVTGGGVALDEVHPRTLESRRCPGLYLCGEMLDAFGPIGGHNFAWAWSTGHAAGSAAGAAGG